MFRSCVQVIMAFLIGGGVILRAMQFGFGTIPDGIWSSNTKCRWYWRARYITSLLSSTEGKKLRGFETVIWG